jgi:hypothetical protein
MTIDATKTRVKIGLTFVPREIDIDVDDADGFMSDFEAALSSDSKVWWVTDRDGHRHGLVVDKVAYIDVEVERDRAIGFGS